MPDVAELGAAPPRAHRRQRLPGRAARRGGPGRGAHPRRGRRLRGHDRRPALPPGIGSAEAREELRRGAAGGSSTPSLVAVFLEIAAAPGPPRRPPPWPGASVPARPAAVRRAPARTDRPWSSLPDPRGRRAMSSTVPVRVIVNGEARTACRSSRASCWCIWLRDHLGADGHPRRVRHHQLWRLHRPPRRGGREELHGARGPGRRRRGHDDRGHGHRARRPASAPGGLLGAPRPAVRLLHARDDHGRRRPARPQPAPVRGGGPARASRATSAAAPATTTSSRRSWPPPRPAWPRGWERERDRGTAERRQRLGRPGDQAQGGPAADHRPGVGTSTTCR